MRILLLNTDYARFLKTLYGKNPGLHHKTYEVQRAVRNETLFGFADFYTRGYQRLGHTAAEIHVDNAWAQAAWAREHGMGIGVPAPDDVKGESLFLTWLRFRLQPFRTSLRPLASRLGLLARLDENMNDVLLAQIEEFEPDVVHVQNMKVVDSKVLRRAKKKSMTFVTQIGVDPPTDVDLSVYDLGLSVIPWVVEYFQSKGLKAAHCDLAFEPTILDTLGPAPEPDIDVSFVGSISSSHSRRIELLEAIALNHRLSLWVPSLDGIPLSSPLHACRQGEVYGRDMYEVLRRSRISINNHIDVARGSAGNMRLYEATGVGSMLLTDDLSNLSRLFEPNAEVATFASVRQCVEKIGYYLEHPDLRRRIAAAGQKRTLAAHTYARRTQRICRLLDALAQGATLDLVPEMN